MSNVLFSFAEKLKSLGLLFIRLVLAYGFYNPAMKKWNGIENVSGWFDSLGMPLPTLSAYLTAIFESLGVILLFLGLFTRYISLPLMFIMIIAIFTVHWSNGFSAGNNGYEIPLYYFIMLFYLFAAGPGKFSLDQMIFKNKE